METGKVNKRLFEIMLMHFKVIQENFEVKVNHELDRISYYTMDCFLL